MGTECLLTVVFLLSLSVTIWMVMKYQRELVMLMDEDFPQEMLATQKVYVRVFWFQIVSFLIGTIAIFALACHRIAGTYIALKRTFGQIKEGDHSVRLKFREYDRLEDVADAFNEMMDSILKRPSAPQDPAE
jgi:methyl-accepting chemotaxis protein